jgi:hypothetical protein
MVWKPLNVEFGTRSVTGFANSSPTKLDTIGSKSEMCSLMRIHYYNIIHHTPNNKSRDSSVGIALGYGLDDGGSGVRFPAGGGNFSVHHRVQNGSRAHTASYPMVTRGSLAGSKAPGA